MLIKIFNAILFRINNLNRKLFKNEISDLKYIVKNLNINVHTIFDVGANVGNTVKIFNSIFPESSIHAFEPNPSVFDKLQKNCNHIKNLKLNNIGVGNKEGVLKLNRHVNSGATSFKNPNNITNPNYSKNIVDQIEVPIQTLHNYTKDHQIKSVDLLKIDVEGFEQEVLEGISSNYLQDNIQLIMIESNLIEKMMDQALIENIIDFLRKHNFTLYNIYTQQESKNKQLFIVNLIFVNNSKLGLLS